MMTKRPEMTDEELLEENARQSAWEVGLQTLPFNIRRNVLHGIVTGQLRREIVLSKDRVYVAVYHADDARPVWAYELLRDDSVQPTPPSISARNDA